MALIHECLIGDDRFAPADREDRYAIGSQRFLQTRNGALAGHQIPPVGLRPQSRQIAVGNEYIGAVRSGRTVFQIVAYAIEQQGIAVKIEPHG